MIICSNLKGRRRNLWDEDLRRCRVAGMIHNCLAGGFNLVSQSVFAEESQLHAKTPLWQGLCRKCKVSVMLASQCSHCAEWKKGLCCHPCTEETEATVAWRKKKRAGWPRTAIHHQYHHPCVFVCLCCSAVIDRAPSPPAGSAMSGLDGLIGAEERIINSKPKISNNVVRVSIWLFIILSVASKAFSNSLDARTESRSVKAQDTGEHVERY